jgi:hypothetical protein
MTMFFVFAYLQERCLAGEVLESHLPGVEGCDAEAPLPGFRPVTARQVRMKQSRDVGVWRSSEANFRCTQLDSI